MDIHLVKIGRVKQLLQAPCAHYQQRIRSLNPLQVHICKNDAAAHRLLLPWLAGGAGHLVALDERGAPHTSPHLATTLRTAKENPAIKQLIYLVGSPYGLPDSWQPLIHSRWSLSQATLPADLAWLLLGEQVYRALTILAGCPYHHG